ncbi:MAG: hypothetical protein H9928_09200 [Candidatus Phocaeicola excrementipullorum]|uniref:Uncharacterized protein n=1 Tax=Candidatus Phocaeicola excrementipullorum TaxID=2838731 RepID=A0A948X3C4_9BACT|nr:hypothetical protein [Candidatus Phocaeicola excrementipullorum]
MKKLLSVAVMCLCSFVLCAQKEVTTFLGIPVDGTKSEMIEKLKAKGFKYETLDENDFLTGEFNGMDVHIFVVTNNNKVCRIMVSDAKTMNETDIRTRFNKLCRQFDSNGKYICPAPSLDDYIIPDDEDISYKMTVDNKRYETLFYQCPVNVKADSDSLRVQTLALYFAQKHANEDLSKLTEEQIGKLAVTEFQQMIMESNKRPVWFTIDEHMGEYYITMFYDNEYNRANGEDL